MRMCWYLQCAGTAGTYSVCIQQFFENSQSGKGLVSSGFFLFCFRGCIDFKLCTCMFSMNLHSSVFASPSTAPARVAAAIYVNIFVIIFKKSLWARYAHAL